MQVYFSHCQTMMISRLRLQVNRVCQIKKNINYKLRVVINSVSFEWPFLGCASLFKLTYEPLAADSFNINLWWNEHNVDNHDVIAKGIALKVYSSCWDDEAILSLALLAWSLRCEVLKFRSQTNWIMSERRGGYTVFLEPTEWEGLKRLCNGLLQISSNWAGKVIMFLSVSLRLFCSLSPRYSSEESWRGKKQSASCKDDEASKAINNHGRRENVYQSFFSD